jgi:hypothetical protein
MSTAEAPAPPGAGVVDDAQGASQDETKKPLCIALQIGMEVQVHRLSAPKRLRCAAAVRSSLQQLIGMTRAFSASRRRVSADPKPGRAALLLRAAAVVLN